MELDSCKSEHCQLNSVAMFDPYMYVCMYVCMMYEAIRTSLPSFPGVTLHMLQANGLLTTLIITIIISVVEQR